MLERRKEVAVAPYLVQGPRFPRVVLICLLAFSAGWGCSRSGAEAAPRVTLEEVLGHADTISLMENDTVLNVRFSLRLTPSGRFLVTDEAENRVRLYEPHGALVFQVGAPGDGPGEYRQAVVSVVAPDGRFWGFDGNGKVVVYDRMGSRQHEIRLPFLVIYDAHPVDDTIALIAGRSLDLERRERLHLVDIFHGTVLESFFLPEVPDALEATANSAGFTHFKVKEGRVYSTFSLKDTVFVFDIGGGARGSIPIPAEGIRPPRPLTHEASQSMRGMAEWLGSFSLVSEVFPLCEDRFLVQYQDRENMLPIWRWVLFDATGGVLFELRDVPRILDVGVEPDCRSQLLIHNPETLTHQEILSAELTP
jgi:hypothetical protein